VTLKKEKTMPPKVLVIKGSPRRKGNSAVLADQALLGARESGAEVDEVYLHSMNIRPCAGCDGCRKGKRECVTKDDMQKLYPKMEWADAVIIASPIYFFTFSAQVKLFIDRLYRFEQPEGNALKGKKFGILLVYGDTDVYTSGAINAINTYERVLGYMGNKIDALVYGSAGEPGEIAADEDVMERARRMGRQLGATA
jgi:multimeric flavodoxin WrbA